MGHVLRWLWPEFDTLEDAERALRGAARVWFAVGVVGLVLTLLPTVVTAASAEAVWPLLAFHIVDMSIGFALLALICHFIQVRRSRLLPLLLILLFCWASLEDPGGIDPFGLVVLGGIGLVTINALRAANAWHEIAATRIQWSHLGIATALFLFLTIVSISIDPDTALSLDYPKTVTWRSWVSLLVSSAAVLVTAFVTRLLPVAKIPGGRLAAPVPAGATRDAG
jgi:hypothetical protein